MSQTLIVDELFTIPEALSPRLVWMKKYNVRTHEQKNGSDDDFDPWCAWPPKDDWSKVESGCYAPDNEYLVGFGKTEADAILAMAVANNIKLWNEQ